MLNSILMAVCAAAAPQVGPVASGQAIQTVETLDEFASLRAPQKGKGGAKGKQGVKGKQSAKGKAGAKGKRQPQKDWTDPAWFWQPILNVQYVSINGASVAQATGGLLGGFNTRYRHNPHWLNTARASLTGSYGLSSGAFGADVRVGNFIGPDGKILRYQVGPDLFYNGYGSPNNTADQYLQWTPGLDIRNLFLVKIADEFNLQAEVAPGWVFLQGRKRTEGPLADIFHELMMYAGANINWQGLRVSAGYRKTWNSFGSNEGIVFSGSL